MDEQKPSEEAPNVSAIYTRLHEMNPGAVEGTGWASTENMQTCYQAVVDAWDVFGTMTNGPVKDWAGTDLLDVGCGYGSLYEFLDREVNLPPDNYMGVDTNPDYIDYARTRYPLVNFFNNDILKMGGMKLWDITVMVGTLSWHPPERAWPIVRRALDAATEGLVMVQHKDTGIFPTTAEIELRTGSADILSVTLGTGSHTAYYILPPVKGGDDKEVTPDGLAGTDTE